MQAYNFKRKNMKLRLLLLTFLLALFSINESNAQLLQWNTFGNTGLELTEPSVSNDPNVLISNLILGPGVTSAANANRFGGNNWWNTGNTSPSTLAEAVAGNDYIQFTVSPNIGFSFTATSFVFNWDKSGSGPQNVALRSSNDGYSVNLGSVVPTAAIGTQNTITISGLVNVTVATTFRLYGYGATGTTGTGGFDIGSNVINVILNGSTSPTAPQPEINLQGNAISIVSGDVTPSLADHTDFGTTPTTGGTIIRTFTIQNTGTLILNVGAITFSGANAADFIVTTPPSATVVASGSTTFQVTFDPSADGLRNAVISIVNNDSDENPYTFAIRGNGISAPVITSSLTASGNQGSAFTYTITATNSPTSYTATGLPAGLANGTNRVGAFVQCLVSVFTFRKSSKFKPLLQESLWLMIPTILGSIIGATYATQVTDELLTKVIGYLMVFMLGIVLLKPKRWLIETAARKNNKSILNFVLFFGIGWYAGFIQMGMGILFLAALVLLSKYSIIDANFIKIIICVILLLPALLIYIYNDQVAWKPAIALAIGQGFGGWLATKYALENESAAKWVRYVLIVMITLAIVKLFNLHKFLI